MLIVDNRIRECERIVLEKLDKEILEIPKSHNVYEEISSHSDIFFTKILDTLVVEKNMYQIVKDKLYKNNIKYIIGSREVSKNYPYDILYNICIIGNNAIHNFKYTDDIIIHLLDKNNFNKININQGYSNCSIAVIDSNSAIVTDRLVGKKLEDNNIDVLYIEEKLDIKLLKKDSRYSNMNGFIGGAITRVDENIIIFGDLNYIDKENKIRSFIEDKGLNIIDFSGLDVIDYGGIIKI